MSAAYTLCEHDCEKGNVRNVNIRGTCPSVCSNPWSAYNSESTEAVYVCLLFHAMHSMVRVSLRSL